MDSTLQTIKAETFKALHINPGLFIIPNPWDAGSAMVLEHLGFQALATTSSGLSFSLGRPDGAAMVSRDEAISHAGSIHAASRLPVSADLERGFGDEPEDCAETIRQAGIAGLVGGSIEDATSRPEDPIYPLDLSIERVKAAVAAARSLPFPFMLCARAENYLHGRPDLNDTIKRLEAYADAGADVLFAPGLRTREEVDSVVRAVSPKAVNVILGLTGSSLTIAELRDLGVRRVSVGSALARAAYGAFLRAAREIHENETFSFAAEAIPFADINGMFHTLHQAKTR
jgi:2-methylisocitrate lyase-like PEP mutase family enzyme